MTDLDKFLRDAERFGREQAAHAAAYTGPAMPFTHNGHNREAAFPWLSHVEVAGMVRMLMRDDVAHELIVCAARDRILHLAQLCDRKDAALRESRIALAPFKMVADAFRHFPDKAVLRTAIANDGVGNLTVADLRRSDATWNALTTGKSE